MGRQRKKGKQNMKANTMSSRKSSLLGFVCFILVAACGFFYNQSVGRLQKIATAMGKREETEKLHVVGG
jgi:hypothetical protein